MSRDAIRRMKKTLRASAMSPASDGDRTHAIEAALALLERSVRMRHRRLAVQQLNDAVTVGARVPDEHWRYCHEAAAASRDTTVQALFVLCAQTAQAALKGLRNG